jgi:hypothetical protein
MATRQLSDKVTAYLGQDLATAETLYYPHSKTGRSPYLTVVLHKPDTGDLIRLKLSTVRKLFKLLESKNLLVARRLSLLEKLVNKL